MAQKRPLAQGKSQSGAFESVARELGCDESEERFDAALRKVGQYKPPPDQKPVKPKKEKPAK